MTLFYGLTSEQQQLILTCAAFLLDRNFDVCHQLIVDMMDKYGLGNNLSVRWLMAQYIYEIDASDERAHREVWDCVNQDPTHPFSLNLLARIFMTRQEYDQAIKWFNEAIKFYPAGEPYTTIINLQRRPEYWISKIVKSHRAEITMKDEDSIEFLTREIKRFTEERDWDQFHNGKDLAIALSGEASELLELYLWKNPEDVDVERIKEELADVINYALLIASKYNLEVRTIVMNKLHANAKKYPVEKAFGKADKYTEL